MVTEGQSFRTVLKNAIDLLLSFRPAVIIEEKKEFDRWKERRKRNEAPHACAYRRRCSWASRFLRERQSFCKASSRCQRLSLKKRIFFHTHSQKEKEESRIRSAISVLYLGPIEGSSCFLLFSFWACGQESIGIKPGWSSGPSHRLLERKRSLREVKRQPRRIQRDYERKIAAEANVSCFQEVIKRFLSHFSYFPFSFILISWIREPIICWLGPLVRSFRTSQQLALSRD